MIYLKLRWTFFTLIRELKLHKFKAIARYFYDGKYRRDVNVIRDELCWGKLKSFKNEIPLGEIQSSHDINYSDWVIKLTRQLRDDTTGIIDKRPIKVYSLDGRWIVIDGNHRLMAMNLIWGRERKVPVQVLRHVASCQGCGEWLAVRRDTPDRVWHTDCFRAELESPKEQRR